MEPTGADTGSVAVFRIYEEAEAVMTWMQTRTGKVVSFQRPDSASITAVDIAHALSMQCRYNGHTLDHYSVAEHCCHVSDSLPPHLRIYGLLHDAHEAYLGDMPRPIKRIMPPNAALWWEILEMEFDTAICTSIHMGLDPLKLRDDAVKRADRLILNNECDAIWGYQVQDWGLGSERLAGVTIKFWPADEARKQWLTRLKKLVKEL